MESQEKRIYVVVAEQYQKMLFWGSAEPMFALADHPPGRIVAQVAHVVSKMRICMIRDLMAPCIPDPITTIVLSARNDKELKLLSLFMIEGHMAFESFHDENHHDYGSHNRSLTALCTYPTTPSSVDGILDHLPLWSPKLK